jgi:hypothetical protein
MTELQWEVNLTQWFIEGTFSAAILFAMIYIPFYKWRETITGRATAILDLAIAGSLLHSSLLSWGVTSLSVKADGVANLPPGFWNNTLTWVSIISVGAAGVSIVTLTFAALQHLEPETTNRFFVKVLHLGGNTGRKDG